MSLPHERLPFFLVASPNLQGSTFEHAVILLVHWSEDSAMGFIINVPIEINDIKIEGTDKSLGDFEELRNLLPPIPTHFGGPVREGGIWMLDTHFDHPPSACKDDYITHYTPKKTSKDTSDDDHGRLKSPLDDKDDSYDKYYSVQRTFLGYSAWEGDQLLRELQEGSWLILEFQNDIFQKTEFNDTPEGCSPTELRDTIWNDCLKRLGVDDLVFSRLNNIPKLQ